MQADTSGLGLVEVVQKLSLAREIQQVMDVVRRAARRLTGADGATFVLRDDDMCFYADEDAIAPLFKGGRFPMTSCISGWAMLHGEAVVIEDIYRDDRIPQPVYRPTFVKSLAMVPIRKTDPLGAIGAYWATRHRATKDELAILQALADSTCIALENIAMQRDLERRVAERTEELEWLSSAVAHDLRGGLQVVDGYLSLLQRRFGSALDTDTLAYVDRAIGGTEQMRRVITSVLTLATATHGELRAEAIDLAPIARAVAADLALASPDRALDFRIEEPLPAYADATLMHVAFSNLLGNAVKFTRDVDAIIEVGRMATARGEAFFVRDNGAGFDPAHAERLFTAFKRLHDASDFAGTGIGLATVQRIIRRHGGEIWAEGHPGRGATFLFTLPGEAGG